MSFLDAREHGSKVGSGGHASAQNEVHSRAQFFTLLGFKTCMIHTSCSSAACPDLRGNRDLSHASRSLFRAIPESICLSSTISVLPVAQACKAGMSLQAIDRRERLRRLALETIDLSKDPYFMRNHLGQYECRLCLTLHNNEGNYLAHTQVSLHGLRIPLLPLVLPFQAMLALSSSASIIHAAA